jgi:hypothetical protein
MFHFLFFPLFALLFPSTPGNSSYALLPCGLFDFFEEPFSDSFAIFPDEADKNAPKDNTKGNPFSFSDDSNDAIEGLEDDTPHSDYEEEREENLLIC